MTHKPDLPELVVEVANCHGGEYDYLRRLVSAFEELTYPSKSIKFQVFKHDSIALSDFEWFEVYKKLWFSPDEWRSIFLAASKAGDVWVDVFDRYSVDILQNNIELVSGIKLQASVLENVEVLDGLKSFDLDTKKMIINISGYDVGHVSQLRDKLRLICPNLILQVGFQSYPTEVADSALQKIEFIRASFPESPIGMADHADASSDFAKLVPIYANLLGCDFIEKHFCLDRESAKYDSHSSLEPLEMQELCDRLVQQVAARTGEFVGEREAEYLRKTVQIPIAGLDVPGGALLNLNKLKFRRTSQVGLSWDAIVAAQQQRQVLARPVTASRAIQTDDFRDAHIAAVVACRMKSSRLPKKATVPIEGVPSVEHCLNQCLAIPGLDRVILATSDLPEDAVLAEYLAGGRADFWQGDPDDVIGRYLAACDHFSIDVVIRVTGDCPFVSPEILTYLLNAHFATGADYTAAANCAVGTSGEIINVEALRRVAGHFGRAEMSEYMTWYFRNNPDVFQLNIVDLPPEMIRDYRLTLDYPEDLQLFQKISAGLEGGGGYYEIGRVFDFLDKHPDVAAINSEMGLRYVTDQELVKTLNRVTKFRTEDGDDNARGRV